MFMIKIYRIDFCGGKTYSVNFDIYGATLAPRAISVVFEADNISSEKLAEVALEQACNHAKSLLVASVASELISLKEFEINI